MSSALAVLDDIAKAYGSRVQKAKEYDPNICSFIQDPANRARLVAKCQPLIQRAALELSGFWIKIFANKVYLRIMGFCDLPEVFSINRIDPT
jgi:hypothetical protein